MNKYLLAFLEDQTGDTLTSVTFGGVAMTQLGKVSRGPNNIGTFQIYAYGLVNPLDGAQTFAATRVGTSGGLTLLGIALTGISQVIGPDVIKTQQGPAVGSPKSDTITTITNNNALFGMAINDNGSIGFTTQTQIASSPTTAAVVARSSTFPSTPAGAVTFNWNQNAAGDWADILVSLAPNGTPAINTQSTWTRTISTTTVSYSYTAYAAAVATSIPSGRLLGGFNFI